MENTQEEMARRGMDDAQGGGCVLAIGALMLTFWLGFLIGALIF